MVRDKLAGTHETQEYLTSVLEVPIITPCCRGAEIYRCDFKTIEFLDNLKVVNADYAEIKSYAIGGLSLEAAFLKQTMAAVISTLGGIVARLSTTFGSGAAFAVADGPFPFGDAIAVVLAAGRTAWSRYDFYEARKQLPAELTVLLKRVISDCQAACRRGGGSMKSLLILFLAVLSAVSVSAAHGPSPIAASLRPAKGKSSCHGRLWPPEAQRLEQS